MLAKQIFDLGLGLAPPWKVMRQRLDTVHTPTKLHMEIGADRGALYPCPGCGSACKAHDFKESMWRDLKFFQPHCYLTARLPRINCPEHGIRRVEAPWAREGSRFTLLFEQVVMSPVRKMPINAIEVTDTRLWRIAHHYAAKAITALNLKSLKVIGLNETAPKRGNNYITVFIDQGRSDKPVIFATPGKGKECLTKFCSFIEAHKGHPEYIVEVVCDLSPAFLSTVEQKFKAASVTVDWLYVVQVFIRAVDDVRKLKTRQSNCRTTPAGLCSRAPRPNAHRIRRKLSWISPGWASLPPRPTVSKNFCAGFDGLNRSRPPSGASPIFLSMLPSARYWNPCAEHGPALRDICHLSFIVGSPCTEMRGSKGSMACSRQRGPEPGDTGTWKISSPWFT